MPDPSTIASWTQLGFAAFVAVYLITKAIPRMEDRAEQRDTRFLTAMDKMETDHRTAEAEGREWYERQVDAIRADDRIRRPRPSKSGLGD